MSKRKNLAIAGFVKPGFEAVREAFVENFTRRNELGPPVASTTGVKKWSTCGAASERVWSTRSGRVRWICRPTSQGRVCVHPQPHGEVQALETGMYLIGSTYNFCCSHQEREPSLYRQRHHGHNDKLLRWRVV